MLVGKRGQIIYIGPLINDDQLEIIVHQHIRDTSYGAEKLRNFKVTESNLNKQELSKLFLFCRSFDDFYKREIVDLIEYKLEIVERTTYYV